VPQGISCGLQGSLRSWGNLWGLPGPGRGPAYMPVQPDPVLVCLLKDLIKDHSSYRQWWLLPLLLAMPLASSAAASGGTWRPTACSPQAHGREQQEVARFVAAFGLSLQEAAAQVLGSPAVMNFLHPYLSNDFSGSLLQQYGMAAVAALHCTSTPGRSLDDPPATLSCKQAALAAVLEATGLSQTHMASLLLNSPPVMYNTITTLADQGAKVQAQAEGADTAAQRDNGPAGQEQWDRVYAQLAVAPRKVTAMFEGHRLMGALQA